MSFILFNIFFIIMIVNWLLIKKIDFGNLSFYDGFLIGLFYYISIPMVIISLVGEVDSIFNMHPYRPVEDLSVTLNIIMGAIVIFFASFFIKNRDKPNELGKKYSNFTKKWSLFFIFLYFIFAIISFISSGKMSGGHWHDTTSEALSGSTSFILFLTFTNILRTCVFGVLIFLVEKCNFSTKTAVLIGLLVVLFDIFTTFNRITGVYFIIMMIIIFRKYKYKVSFSIALFFPIVFLISSIWPSFRGLALTDGYSIKNFVEAASNATNSFKDNFSTTLNDFLFPIFESANIVAYKYVVEHAGTPTFPFLFGETYIVRSTLFLLPTTIWSSKPPVFATLLGDKIQGGGIAINSTFLGEIYANFYFLWPLVLFSTLLFLNFLFNKLSRWFAPAGFCGAFIAFALWRFDATFMGTSIFLLILFILFKSLIINLSTPYKS